MIDEYVKNHTEKEVVAYLANRLGLLKQCMEKALEEQNMYNLSANVVGVAHLSELAKALDKKMNGAKSKVL